MFTSRWWRFSFFDRFDRFDVDVAQLERSIEQGYPQLVAFDAALNGSRRFTRVCWNKQRKTPLLVCVRPLMVCLLSGPRFGNLAPLTNLVNMARRVINLANAPDFNAAQKSVCC